MSQLLTFVGLAAAGCGSLLAQAATGDAARGAQLVRDRSCIVCHKVNGEGGSRAPDLSARRSRNYTPAGLAELMWNHAPSAWAQGGASWEEPSAVSAGQVADLFAFFTSRRYFEPLGDARRGRQVFLDRKCASCHGIRERISADVTPVAEWRSLRDPIEFARDMWNLQTEMGPAYQRKGVLHPRLASREVNDLLVYLENLRDVRGRESHFQLAAGGAGSTLFHAMECDSCHQGKRSLERHPERISMAHIEAAIWNHALTRLKKRRPVTYEEMSELVAYLWSLQPPGDPHRGEAAFAKKKCADCHAGKGNGAPALTERELSPVSLIAALWSHGPAMQTEMNKKGVVWPRIGKSEIADIAAYLRTRQAPPASQVKVLWASGYRAPSARP